MCGGIFSDITVMLQMFSDSDSEISLKIGLFDEVKAYKSVPVIWATM